MSTKKAAASAPSGAAAVAQAIPSKITKNCTLAQLRTEATFRGLDLGTVPLSKAQLLEILGDGSTSSKAAAEKAKRKAPAAAKKAASTTTAATNKKKKTAAKSSAPAKKTEATAKKPAAAAAASKKTETTTKKPAATAAASKKTKTTTTKMKASAGSPTKKKSPAQPSPSKQLKLTSMVSGKKKASEKATAAAGLKKKKKDVAPIAASESNEPTRKKVKTEPVLSSPTATVKPPTGPTKKHKDAVAPNAASAANEPTRKKVKTEPVLSLPTSTIATTAATVKPPAAAKKATTVVQPRISKKLTLAQLKEEAEARGLQNKEQLPKTKADLLHFMVDGSIHVAESVEYKRYQNLLKRLEEERPQLYQQSLANHEAELQKQDQRRHQKADKDRRAREEKAEKDRLAREAERTSEISKQKSLHQHSFPRVHAHLLARTCELTMNGNPRFDTSRCDLCGDGGGCYFELDRGVVYTCEQCNWDVCANCFEDRNMTPQERREKEEKERIEQEKRRREQKERQKRMEEEWRQQEAEEELRWDAKKQFAAGIIKPTTTNKTLDAKGHEYVVWCSDGYGNDGWHSHNDAPDQHFDTCWKTAKEANDRARYLFFWKNSYGIDPDELSDDDGDPEPKFREGLVTYSVEPADSTRWTVGVVPAAAFRHLPEATTERHNFDDEGVPRQYMGYGIAY